MEWTDATWNPVRGCTRVSPGCGGPGPHGGCYAEELAGRFSGINSKTGQPMWGHGFAETRNGVHRWTGKVALIEDKLLAPLHWRAPMKIFVNSTSDLFHEKLPDEAIDRVFAVMAVASHHTFQILTKRPERMWLYMTNVEREALWMNAVANLMEKLGLRDDQVPILRRREPWLPLPNVWLGTSVEDQERADERIPALIDTSAAVRFISAEPLLGPIDLTELPSHWDGEDRPLMRLNALRGVHKCGPAVVDATAKLDWVIAGGESGDTARPMHPEWARALRDQCTAAGVPFFFKQWGEYLPVGQSLPGFGKIHGATAVKPGRMKLHYGGTPQEAPKHAFVERGVEFASTADGRLTFRVGKGAAGRLLDGREWNEFPKTKVAA